MERPSDQPWLRMKTRVLVREKPFGWGYLGVGVLLAIGVAAVVNADRHTEEHRQAGGRK